MTEPLWIQTHTGRQVTYPPQAEQVCIEDIAHALSRICRYSGHTPTFYSVAEHCCHLYDHALTAAKCRDTHVGALLHDAAEAYLGDVPGPFKRLLPDYRDLEKTFEDVICERFDLLRLAGTLVRTWDRQIIADEQAALFPEMPRPWKHPVEGPLGVEIQCWSPDQADYEYLARAGALGLT